MVLLRLAHDHILANIVTGSYNKLLSYFVLFTFEHASHMRIAITSLSTGRQTLGTQQLYSENNKSFRLCVLARKAGKTLVASY